MSTYTSYTVKARENLSRIRNPGCRDDGLSPERVIFANPNNIYNGTFIGTVKSEDREFANCKFSNCSADGGRMDDVELYYDGQRIDLTQIIDLSGLIIDLSGSLRFKAVLPVSAD